jgi:hypothetical protein
MYSWSGIGVPTTKAIIRESARLVNLTLGRAGFFMLRRLLRGERPLEQIDALSGVRTTLKRSQGTG